MKKSGAKLPSILVQGKTLAEGWQKAMIACYENGIRSADPSYQDKLFYAYDADITVRIENPLEEPIRHKYSMYDDDRGLMQYILEVTHGIHNHWVKDPDDPNDTRWSYTYNGRFASQLPFIFARIKQDWEKKGNLSSRKYTFNTWRPKDDVILEQGDPPCLQRGHLRFLEDNKREWWLNYLTDWRSRDLAKAWSENNLGQIKLMELFANKISDMLEIPIHIGSYTDRNTSLHIYGRYFEEEGLEGIIKPMKNMTLETMSVPLFEEDEKSLKKLIAAQMHAEKMGSGTNLSADVLKGLNYNLETFPYPTDWDSWPKEWNQELDKSTLI